MAGYPPVFIIGFACALIGAGVVGYKIAPDQSSQAAPTMLVSAGAAAVSLPICGSAKRINCIVDGDTLWVNGEKIRLEGINTPEMNGSCARESQLAIKARDELRRALDGRSFTIERNGRDRYGRTLATIRVAGKDVGERLIQQKLAHQWRGRKESWC